VRDRIDGVGTHPLVWRFHLDPNVEASRDGYDVRLSHREADVWLLPGATPHLELSLEAGWVSPSYGVKIPTTVVIWRSAAPLPCDSAFVFAERRLNADERAAVVAGLAAASVC